jgi:hypothetical protein
MNGLDVDNTQSLGTLILASPDSFVQVVQELMIWRGIGQHQSKSLDIISDCGLKKELYFAIVECVISRVLGPDH